MEKAAYAAFSISERCPLSLFSGHDTLSLLFNTRRNTAWLKPTYMPFIFPRPLWRPRSDATGSGRNPSETQAAQVSMPHQEQVSINEATAEQLGGDEWRWSEKGAIYRQLS